MALGLFGDGGLDVTDKLDARCGLLLQSGAVAAGPGACSCESPGPLGYAPVSTPPRSVYDVTAFHDVRMELDRDAPSVDGRFIQYAIARNADQIAQQQWWTLAMQMAKAMCA